MNSSEKYKIWAVVVLLLVSVICSPLINDYEYERLFTISIIYLPAVLLLLLVVVTRTACNATLIPIVANIIFLFSLVLFLTLTEDPSGFRNPVFVVFGICCTGAIAVGEVIGVFKRVYQRRKASS